MKHIHYYLFFLFIFPSAYSQGQDTTLNIIRVGVGSMSDLPAFNASDGKTNIHFPFIGQKTTDVNLEIALWESVSNSDFLSKMILTEENLRYDRHQRLDLFVEQDGINVNIKSVLSGEYLMITPLKPKNRSIKLFLFKSNPKIENKHVPIVLLIDNDNDVLEKDLFNLLVIQDIKEIKKKTIEELKKRLGNFKLLTYYLKPLE